MRAQKKNVTIYDIAREAEVSPATVSRILTGSTNVRTEKRQRVEKLIEKYHFHPNALARALTETQSHLIGMLVASSRLYAAMAEDGILSKWFAYRNQEGNPSNAILFCAVISCIILVLGRTAIEWVVDITTLGGAIAYGLTSFSAYRIAVQRGDQKERIFGLLGILVSVWFGFTFMFP